MPLLLVGVPLLLLVVGGTTWAVVGRALAPVERIRREVDDDRRGAAATVGCPVPESRDEIAPAGHAP